MSDQTRKVPRTIEHGYGFDRTVLRVSDLKATAAKLRAIGATPSPTREGADKAYRVIMVTDPDGYRLELVESRKRH